MNLSQKQQGNLIMFIVILLFSANIPINKYIYANHLLSPIGMTLLRATFGAIMFWIVSLFLPSEKVEKRDMLILLAGGIFGMVLNQGLFAYGLSRTSAIDASIITTAGPLFAMLIAAVLLREPITMMKAGGVVVGAGGAIFLVYTSHLNVSHGNESDLLGNLMVTGGAFSYAFYLVITRPLSDKYHSITMMKWMFLYSSLVMLPFSYKEVIEAPLFYQADTMPFILLAFTLFGATFLTYMMIPLAQRRIRPTTIAMYNNLQPLFTSIIAIFIGMDKFTIEKLIAGIIIFAGVYLVTASKSRADLEEEGIITK